eukprot:TRINITY_DN47139_c0_g1_i1.p1 TRINITY_DN47139_c0_g1~~TRINITY_DN47139_c0_g1_i1.p1  ORF type:complete len:610 (-),score=205.93 TRINITY_DN47139_c0_g1_i1:619-2448(-)
MSGYTDADAAVAAARQQQIQNLRLKTTCLENEERIQELHISDWSEKQRIKLQEAHEKSAQLLAGVETGTRWHLTTTYDFSTLQRICGLEMTIRELFSPDDKPELTDVLALKRTLQNLKSHHNKARLVAFTGVIDSSLNKLAQVEEELRKSQFDATELAQVPLTVLKNLEDCMNVQNVQAALTSNEEQIQQQMTAIEKCKDIRDMAIADGEMQIAEDQYIIKAQLLERVLDLVSDKFRIIGTTEEENRQFAKIADVQKQSHAETSAMREHRRRLKARCEGDLRALQLAVQKADLEDMEAARQFAETKFQSEKKLKENLESQDECWRRIQALERDLQRLGTERFEEVRKRIDDNDREEKRKVEYEQFISLTSQHRALLDLTVYNCDLAIRTIGLVEELVAEGCAAIKQRYDTTNQELAQLRLLVHQEYLAVFRRLYRTLSILCYKKEKALEECGRQSRQCHIQLELCIETYDPNAKKYADLRKELFKKRANLEEQVNALRDKMNAALEAFAPTEEALLAAGFQFVHPLDEAEEGNLQRRSRMVEYRAHMAKQQDLKIAAERQEIRIMKTILHEQTSASQQQRLAITAGTNAGSPSHHAAEVPGTPQHRTES